MQLFLSICSQLRGSKKPQPYKQILSHFEYFSTLENIMIAHAKMKPTIRILLIKELQPIGLPPTGLLCAVHSQSLRFCCRDLRGRQRLVMHRVGCCAAKQQATRRDCVLLFLPPTGSWCTVLI